MKKVIYIITTILLCMTSCTDIHDTYSEYIKDGEQIYVGKLADVNIQPGFQRMMIKGSMKYLATAKTCIIELVGYDKVFTTDIDRTQPEFSYEIKDVEEGNYYVKITTKDKEGNTSLSETYNVDVYGAHSDLLSQANYRYTIRHCRQLAQLNLESGRQCGGSNS